MIAPIGELINVMNATSDEPILSEVVLYEGPRIPIEYGMALEKYNRAGRRKYLASNKAPQGLIVNGKPSKRAKKRRQYENF